MTACRLAQANKNVLLVASGIGALLLASGCIDVLGYQPVDSRTPVKDPLSNLDAFLADNPEHPYQFVGRENIEAGLEAFRQVVLDGSLEYRGVPNRNWLLPSAMGAIHPTCLAPTSLTNGTLDTEDKMLVVGFRELRDFYPALISQNLNAQGLGVAADSLTLGAPEPVSGQMNITPIELAQAFEKADFRQRVVKAIKTKAIKDKSKNYRRIGFPAVLGIKKHAEVLAHLEQELGKTVFEISTLPPSVPGRRLFDVLRHAFEQAGGRLIIGSKVVDGTIEDGRVTQIRFETSNRLRTITAKNYVLATGGIFGGGLETDAGGHVWEPIFGLPVSASPNRHHWFATSFLAPEGQPVARYGVKVNAHFNPVDPNSINGYQPVIAENLYISGSLIAGSDWVRGRTGDGVALASAAAIVKQIGESDAP
jgi:glycerol-3-phosphate dehydrogenase subunit B